MRKVTFKEWIPKQTNKENNSIFETLVKGTNCFSSEYTGKGLFWQFANACYDSENGFGNYTVALVELYDGTIIEVLPTNIKFELFN